MKFRCAKLLGHYVSGFSCEMGPKKDLNSSQKQEFLSFFLVKEGFMPK